MALTLEQFVATIKASGLVGLAGLEESVRRLGGDHDPPEPSALAEALVARKALTPWQAEKLLAGVSQGFFLGRHKLLRLVASGSMSSVYEAEHVLKHRRVALKVLPKGLVSEASFLERFYREARAVACLNHPNIIRGYDVGQDGDYHFFVMEFVRGSTLEKLVEESGPRPLDEAAEMIRQAALGLEHAHEAGLVHRDIKPANLLRDVHGTIKILDLGLVRSLPHESEGQAGLTRLHDESVLGTVDYLSPEQAIDSHNVDIRSDIYSLGCTLYYLLTGLPPFSSGTLTERLLAHQSKSPAPITSLRPDVPDSLARIVARMLAKRPESRFQRPGDLAEALGEWLIARREPAPAAPSTGSRMAPPKAVDARPPEDPEESPPAKAEEFRNLELSECWDRWGQVVLAVASRWTGRAPVQEVTYRRIYEELLQACRAALDDADEPTRLTLRRVEDLVAPWPTLRSLQSILNSGMSDTVLSRYYELDPIVRTPPDRGFFRRLLGLVFATNHG